MVAILQSGRTGEIHSNSDWSFNLHIIFLSSAHQALMANILCNAWADLTEPAGLDPYILGFCR
jgi:hypothetical protein